MGGMGLIFIPVLVICLLDHSGLSRPMTGTSWTHSYSNSSVGRYNPPPASYPPPPPTPPLPPAHLLIYMQSVILQWL